MEIPTHESEDTSSAYRPATNFNIAGAFPVTDEIVRKVARAKWQHRLERLGSAPGIWFCIATGLLGWVAASRLRKF